jgi:hypothetical protein
MVYILFLSLYYVFLIYFSVFFKKKKKIAGVEGILVDLDIIDMGYSDGSGI